MQRDMPAIAGSTYTANTVMLAGQGLAMLGGGAGAGGIEDAVRRAEKAKFFVQPQPQEKEPPMAARRLVQVFIADPNENVPLDQSLLYSGEQKLTDATDQELFFEIDIKSILEKHNEKRVKMVDKKVKERVEHLEPAKIRDLKMVVVNVAGF